MADHRSARIGARPVATRRVTRLQGSVRLRASQDVVLIAGDLRSLFGKRVLTTEKIGVRVQIGYGLGDNDALHVHPRSLADSILRVHGRLPGGCRGAEVGAPGPVAGTNRGRQRLTVFIGACQATEICAIARSSRSEEHTSELQSQSNLVCR